MTRIALVRHGQTDWNLEGRLQGSTDIPLNDTGRAQASEAGLRLRGHGYSMIVSSPLSRAVETAELLAAEVGLDGPRERIDGLAERSYGSAEGVESSQLAEMFPHGVPDAEDDQRVVDRVTEALTDLAGRVPDDRIIAATHGGVIGRLIRSLPDTPEWAMRHRIRNGSIHVFEVDGDSLRFRADPAELGNMAVEV